ncbi:MAG: recombinase family protein [Ilumatobacteraceae bacterium]
MPEEAAVVREAAARVLGGQSLASIVVDFNERGIPSAHGKKWRPGSLGMILQVGSDHRATGVEGHGGRRGELGADPRPCDMGAGAFPAHPCAHRSPAEGQPPRRDVPVRRVRRR